MTRASCLPLKKGAFSFSTNRVFTLLENDGSDSSVTLQHLGESFSEPSLTKARSSVKKARVCKRAWPYFIWSAHLYFELQHMKSDNTFPLKKKKLNEFHMKRTSYPAWPRIHHTFSCRHWLFDMKISSWNSVRRHEAICRLWKFYDICVLIVTLPDVLLLLWFASIFVL